jgi:hypothetical protein
MQAESAGTGNSDDGRLEPVSPEAAKSGSGPAHTTGAPKGRLRSVRNWAAAHGGEVFWALVFAAVIGVPLALFAARYFDAPTFKVVVLLDGYHDPHTKENFDRIRLSNWDELKIDNRNLVELTAKHQEDGFFGDNINEYLHTQATKTAGELVDDKDKETLIVIGHVSSGDTEATLPIYLTATSPIPYISTGASDDVLLSHCPHCSGLLQPSPRNQEQAHSAVSYAHYHGKQTFFVVTEHDVEPEGSSYPYERDMSKDFNDNISDFKGERLGTFSTEKDLSQLKERLQKQKPDCILYAGGYEGAHTLLTTMNLKDVLVILSDLVIFERPDDDLHDLGPDRFSLLFTYASDAYDYNHKAPNEYVIDAVDIAHKLVEELGHRGDFWYRVRSMLHLQTAVSVRANLIRIMNEDAANHTWYPCDNTPDDSGACVFEPDDNDENSLRLNGLFHVWRLGHQDSRESAMVDVDEWHPPKDSAGKQLKRNKHPKP